MEAIKAKVTNSDDKYFIDIRTAASYIRIPISDDNPSEVKSAFNKLILQLKAGVFQIELEDVGPDLFSQVALEYVKQLNQELQEVFAEMVKYNLVSR